MVSGDWGKNRWIGSCVYGCIFLYTDKREAMCKCVRIVE
jgi:hypothetical protein